MFLASKLPEQCLHWLLWWAWSWESTAWGVKVRTRGSADPGLFDLTAQNRHGNLRTEVGHGLDRQAEPPAGNL